jgi:hypothetical protein
VIDETWDWLTALRRASLSSHTLAVAPATCCSEFRLGVQTFVLVLEARQGLADTHWITQRPPLKVVGHFQL